MMQTRGKRLRRQCGISRLRAIGRTAAIFIGFQALSYLVLRLALGQFVYLSVWWYGLAGPLVAAEGAAKFRYHGFVANALYILVALMIPAAVMSYSAAPRRWTLMLTIGGVAAWILFGLLQSVHHM
jgi:hypothetical protein